MHELHLSSWVVVIFLNYKFFHNNTITQTNGSNDQVKVTRSTLCVLGLWALTHLDVANLWLVSPPSPPNIFSIKYFPLPIRRSLYIFLILSQNERLFFLLKKIEEELELLKTYIYISFLGQI